MNTADSWAQRIGDGRLKHEGHSVGRLSVFSRRNQFDLQWFFGFVLFKKICIFQINIIILIKILLFFSLPCPFIICTIMALFNFLLSVTLNNFNISSVHYLHRVLRQIICCLPLSIFDFSMCYEYQILQAFSLYYLPEKFQLYSNLIFEYKCSFSSTFFSPKYLFNTSCSRYNFVELVFCCVKSLQSKKDIGKMKVVGRRLSRLNYSSGIAFSVLKNIDPESLPFP